MVFDTLVGDADLVVRFCGEDDGEGVVRQTTGAHIAHSEGMPDVGANAWRCVVRLVVLASELSIPIWYAIKSGQREFRSLISRGPHTATSILPLAQSSL